MMAGLVGRGAFTLAVTFKISAFVSFGSSGTEAMPSKMQRAKSPAACFRWSRIFNLNFIFLAVYA